MSSRSFTLSAVTAALCGLCFAGAARGDDWPQFRKDASRSGASTDEVSFPLTDVWSWNTRDLRESSSLVHTAVWKGRAYFLANGLNGRSLICADAKTGTVYWRQHLQPAPPNTRGVPVVSSGGKVFVYEQRGGKRLPRGGRAPVITPNHPAFPRDLSRVAGPAVLVFDALTGLPWAVAPLDLIHTIDAMPEAQLLHGPPKTYVPLKHLRPSRARTEPLEWLGAPLLNGDELIATGGFGVLFRWLPGSFPSFIRVAHPPPGLFPEITLASLFSGYPPTAAGGGVFVADDKSFRFAAVLGGETFDRWHTDLGNTLGVAGSDGSSIYASTGGVGATRGLVCIDGNTGRVRWSFTPTGLPADPVSITKRSLEYRKIIVADRRNAPLTPDGIAAVSEKLRNRGYDYAHEWEQIWMPQPLSQLPDGHSTNPGVVVTDNRVFGEVSGRLVALEKSTGRPIWAHTLPLKGRVTSLAATAKHLVACVSVSRRSMTAGGMVVGSSMLGQHSLVALNLETGRLEWEQPVRAPGDLALSDGLVYLSNGDLTAMAPAERTYLLSADTDDPTHYAKPVEVEAQPDGTQTGAGSSCGRAPVGGGATDAEPPASTPEARPETPDPSPLQVRAEASWLRLSYGTPLPDLVARIHARQKLLAPREVPLCLQLDWLTPKREGVQGQPGGHWAARDEERFAELCARLAAEAQPLYFDLAPEVNVYLRRFPDRAELVLRMLQRAAGAVRQAAPNTQVTVSLNVETLLGIYGKGSVTPFGELPKADPKTEGPQIAQLLQMTDAAGLTLEPQAGFRNADVIPRDYLLRVRVLLPQMPLLITQFRLQADAPGALARKAEADFIQRMLQCCYWLNARMVAQPDLRGYPPPEKVKKEVRLDPIELAAEKWRRVVFWKRVKRLTAKAPLPDLSARPEPEQDPGTN